VADRLRTDKVPALAVPPAQERVICRVGRAIVGHTKETVTALIGGLPGLVPCQNRVGYVAVDGNAF